MDKDDDVFEDLAVANSHSISLLRQHSKLNIMSLLHRRSSIFEFGHRERPSGSTVLTYSQQPSRIDVGSTAQVQYENTYKMEPVAKLQTQAAKDVIEGILKHHLEGKEYNAVLHSVLSKTIAQEIKDRLSSPDLDRFKLVSFVSIGQKNDHDVRMASRCLWDTNKDTCASAHYENSTLYAVGILYALYFE